MRIVLLLAFAALLAAVQVPATVKHVTDGDTIIATLANATEVKVRLLYIDTPESKDNSHGKARPEGKAATAFLTGQLPVGRHILLVGPGAELERDRYQRSLAVVCIPPADGHSDPPIIVQESIIRAGWSPLWEKYGVVPFDWRPRLVEAERAAREAKAGAWAMNPDYMINKANETTAPKAQKLRISKQLWYYDMNTGLLFPGPVDELPPIPAPSGELAGHPGTPAGALAYVIRVSGERDPRIAYIQMYTPQAKMMIENVRDPKWEIKTGDSDMIMGGTFVALVPQRPEDPIPWKQMSTPEGYKVVMTMEEIAGGKPYMAVFPDPAEGNLQP